MRRGVADGGGRGRAVTTCRAVRLARAVGFTLLWPGVAFAQFSAPVRLDAGRFTVVAYPTDATLARALLAAALAHDTFPGLPRPRERVVIAIAPDMARFREWAGKGAPEWGAALAFPDQGRVVLQGSHAGSEAGNPLEVVRHELAHMALHEYLGDVVPRWFDEGYASYAAHEENRDDALAANLALALEGVPTLDVLEESFSGGSTTAQAAYALAASAVGDMAAIDPQHGLARVFAAWRATGSLDKALRRADGVTLDGFAADWRARTRRRYGALALMEDLAALGLVVLVLVLPLWMARRRRDRARLAAMVAADAQVDRAVRDGAQSDLLGLGTPPLGDGDHEAP